MARTTAAQFARQLRRLGATVTIRDGRDSSDVVASFRGVEVTARFGRDVDAFDVARRTDTTPDTAAGTWAADAASDDADLIRSMAGVRRMLNLPRHPVVTLGTTGRRDSRIHILRPGWFSSAECGVSIPREHREGTPREATCRRCRSLWRQR
ncbi:hypothetical protein [Virgisporangium aurantiacum]|uniref:Uncharacterized protein n=1 Tax=Virgisporangium aurantiacum TaxID=175570 RepID=A0A8J4E7Q8_9ACTN|nr:hypothetical protein [Virgisporangium aurantiacum]GIJ62037.1 hypothetical protein Vau01_095530 [Virgisporangium aurantiacum]